MDCVRAEDKPTGKTARQNVTHTDKKLGKAISIIGGCE
jgi:hypothetical protein